MKLSWRIELSDFKRAQWMHIRPRPFFAVTGCLLITLAVGVFVWSVRDYLLTGESLPGVIGIGFGLGYGAFMLLVLRPRQLEKVYRQSKMLHQEFSAEIDEDGLTLRGPQGESRITWDLFHKWRSARGFVLVYQSDVAFHMFPRKAFASDTEFSEFKELLTRRLGKPA